MLLGCSILAIVVSSFTPPVATFAEVPGQAELGYIEVRGVSAGVFDPTYWDKRTLNILQDLRAPLIEPLRSGPFRNIYAPSAVRLKDSWRIFFGAWDGVNTQNDQIYSLTTPDFQDFSPHRVVIAHGEFTHVCNVNAFQDPSGHYQMMCTVFPDDKGQNKPGYFDSPDGENWNGSASLYEAKKADIVTMTGYAKYDAADINGTNVLLSDTDGYHMYFCNNHDPGYVFRASSKDGKNYTFDGAALDTKHGVNDVRKFTGPHGTWYLMALHQNSTTLWYAVSHDPMHFDIEQTLITNLDAKDQYIVSVGLVCDGGRLLGFLYGAGPVPDLNRNRIYARWLQKKVVFVANDKTSLPPECAIGPDRQMLRLRPKGPLDGHFDVYAEDGRTLIGESGEMTLKPNSIYQLNSIAKSAN